jgi:phage tail sheath protein FI
MPFQLSPGVAVVEKDFSSIVPAVSSSAGAFCGPYAWGPIEDPVRVSSETDLVARFGAPTDGNFQSFFTAANFLSYTNNLLVTRTDAQGLRNAVATRSGSVQQQYVNLTSSGTGYVQGVDTPTVTFSAPEMAGGIRATGTINTSVEVISNVPYLIITGINVTNTGSGYKSIPTVTISAPAAGSQGRATAVVTQMPLSGVKIKNINEYLIAYVNGDGVNGMFAAKFAGTKGNGVRVVVFDAGNWVGADPVLKAQFTGAPGTSSYANSRGVTNDEVHIAIYDNSIGSFSGVANSLLEKYAFVSKLTDARRSDGTNNYYKSVVNSNSKYVWWMDHADFEFQSEPNSVHVVDNTTGSTLVFTSSNKKISINVDGAIDPLYVNYLKPFIDFYNIAPTVDKDRRQIRVYGTESNDNIYTIDSIDTILVNNAITTVVITTVENVTSEVAATGKIESIRKANWGQSAQQVANTVGDNTFTVLKQIVDISLSGGADDFNSTPGQIENAYRLLTNTDEYDISLVPLGNVPASTAKAIVDNLIEVRKDCIAFLSPNTDGEPIISTGSNATEAIKDYRDATNLNTSYAVIDSGFKYQYDRYNDVYRWVPLNGDIAGLCARTDYTADPWYSPGGFNRGQIKNIVKLGFNPSQTERDVLYSAGVNPVVSFPGQGTILYGDKTMQTKPSAFDRINVRRLFIVLEKSIATAAKYQMFEFNDSFTRAQFKNLVEPYLRDVQGRRGVTDFRVKCDESNNTGEVIDRNEFVADIFIKPARSINYITLNFVAARTSVSFEEIGA